MTLGLPVIGLTLIVHVIVIVAHKVIALVKSLRADTPPPGETKQ